MNALEKVLSNLLVLHFTNAFTSKDVEKNFKAYVSKNCHLFNGSEEVAKVRKVPLKLSKLIIVPNFAYAQFTLGVDTTPNGKKFTVYEFKEESGGTVIVEVNYKGSLVNLEEELKKVVVEVKNELYLYATSMTQFDKITNPSEEEVKQVFEEMKRELEKEEQIENETSEDESNSNNSNSFSSNKEEVSHEEKAVS